jgi:hypothetical protein
VKALKAFLKEFLYLGFESYGRYYSSYRGFVIDNNDPLKLGRLKLLVPDVLGNDPYDYWAFAKGQYSGKGHGMQVIPSLGEVVWVEFEQGVPERPIWSHGHFANLDKPKALPQKDFNDITSYYFTTPKGNVVYINDTKKVISITSIDGDRIEINNQAISLATDKKISLGAMNKSKEPAVLGDRLEEVLNEIHALIKDMVTTLATDVSASTAASTPFLMRASITGKVSGWVQKVIDIKRKIKPIKSKKITVD